MVTRARRRNPIAEMEADTVGLGALAVVGLIAYLVFKYGSQFQEKVEQAGSDVTAGAESALTTPGIANAFLPGSGAVYNQFFGDS